MRTQNITRSVRTILFDVRVVWMCFNGWIWPLCNQHSPQKQKKFMQLLRVEKSSRILLVTNRSLRLTKMTNSNEKRQRRTRKFIIGKWKWNYLENHVCDNRNFSHFVWIRLKTTMTVRKGIELCVMPCFYQPCILVSSDFIGNELASDSV